VSLPLLAGLRILDLSQYLPGPYASLILADLGADVVRIEPPGGEPMRRIGPLDRGGLSAWYKQVNREKRVVELDLKGEPGKRLFEELIEAADGLLESYRPGVLARLGFSPERLRALNPSLVVCSLSGWGQTGPYRERGGHDVNYMALMGGLALSGPATAPSIGYPQVTDYASGVNAALCLTAALLRRERTGEGAYLDTSIAESVLPWQGWSLTALQRPGLVVERASMMLNGGAAYYQIYRTKDGAFITLGAIEEKFWRNFCTALGHPEWAERQHEPLPQRALIGEVAALIAGKTLAEWEAVFENVDCCFEPVHPLGAVPGHPQIRARGLVRVHEGEDPFSEVLFPAWLDGAPPAERRPIRFATAEDVLGDWSRAPEGQRPSLRKGR
jgi:crotonobetainyl-CoA:carnitine CoA-transferase CaiB-like acyl-CoA transferase